jgi:transposase
MQALRTHVAGVDVHKEILVITLLIGEANEEPEVIQYECNTFTEDLMACGQEFLRLGIQDVAMESTGVYWKPLYNVWAPMGIKLTVGQAAHMKNVPGRKTDLNDSHWIAELHRHGLIKPSFIPKDEFQRMRLLSRHRTNLVGDLARVKNRIQRILEDGNIKWSSIVSDVFGKSGLQILRVLADGLTDAGLLASKVTTRIKRQTEVKKSLTNCFTTEHCFLIKELLDQYDHLKSKIERIELELSEKVLPYSHLIEKLNEIPGVSDILAIGLLAETTDDMSNFADERKFAAWAGVASGSNESAGKKKDQNVEKGTPIYAKY